MNWKKEIRTAWQWGRVKVTVRPYWTLGFWLGVLAIALAMWLADWRIEVWY